MMRIALLEIIKNSMIFIPLILISCNSNVNKENEKTMCLEINQDLKSQLKKDLNCYRDNYPEIFQEYPFLDIYAEKIEEGYDVHISASNKLEIDKNCHGFFYIDTVVFTVYGEFVPELYKKKGLKYIQSSNDTSRRSTNDDSSHLINDDMISWHYRYENNNVSYLVTNQMCR